MLGSDIVRQVSLDLNDQEPGWEYARWPYEQLRSYMQEAATYVAASLKDLFTHKVVVELETGDVWQEACSCTKIERILGECTEKGRILRRLRRMSDDEQFTWTGGTSKCLFSGDTFDGYMLSSVEDNSFHVFPSLRSGGKKRYVLLECYEEPDVSDEDWTPPDEIVPLLKQWTLWRAMALDSENNTAILQLAQAHLSSFQNLLQTLVQIRMMEKTENGGVRPVSKPASE